MANNSTGIIPPERAAELRAMAAPPPVEDAALTPYAKGKLRRKNRTERLKEIVIMLAIRGCAPSYIARRVGLKRDTVLSILSEEGRERCIAASRARTVTMLPVAENAVRKQMEDGDGDLGLRFLEQTGVIGEQAPQGKTLAADVRLQQAIQILIPPAAPTVAAPPAVQSATIVEGEVVPATVIAGEEPAIVQE